MRAAKNSTAVAVSVLMTIGLLLSQVCALNCAFNDCSFAVAAKPAPPEKPSSHCHHHDDEDESAPTPEQRNESHDCPAHVDAIAALPSAMGSLAAPPQHPQPLAVLPVIVQVSFEDQAGRFSEGSPFRAPPTRAVISALRI